MTVVAQDVRKVVVLGWDTEIVRGTTASIQADGNELRVVKNDGDCNVFYPLDFTGSTEFTVVGSKEGTDTGTVDVSGEEISSGNGGPIIEEGGDEMGNTAEHVFYNDGTNEDLYALVIKDNGGGSLNLQVIPESGDPSIQTGVPQREKGDYDADGGGHTWHAD